MTELTQDLLKELFDYRDGNLYWKVAKAQRIKIGDLAGSAQKSGYRQVMINGKGYSGHRLIFLWYHGYLPEFLDHIDGDPSNNSIDNIREATNQENGWNQKKRKSINNKPTSSKYKGVSWHKPTKKWLTQITIDGKTKHLGLFISEIKAALAYNKAAIKWFGEFAKLNEA